MTTIGRPISPTTSATHVGETRLWVPVKLGTQLLRCSYRRIA